MALARDYPNQRGDFAALARAVSASDADVLASYVSFEPDQVAMARALGAAGVRLPWIGSQFIAADRGGRSRPARHCSAPTPSPRSIPTPIPDARAFADRYDQVFGARADFFAAWPFDAVTILARAMNSSGSAEPGALAGNPGDPRPWRRGGGV